MTRPILSVALALLCWGGAAVAKPAIPYGAQNVGTGQEYHYIFCDGVWTENEDVKPVCPKVISRVDANPGPLPDIVYMGSGPDIAPWLPPSDPVNDPYATVCRTPTCGGPETPALPYEARPGRAYTLAEMDRMRSALRNILCPPNVPYYPDQLNAQIEDQLRTDMQAGIDPAELEAQATTARKSWP